MHSYTNIEVPNKILAYFVRKGKKEFIETNLRILCVNHAIKNCGKSSWRINLYSIRSKISTFSIVHFNKLYIFNSFRQKAVTYIGLKTRRKRRGKFVLNKIVLFTRKRNQAKAFRKFSKNIPKSKRSNKKIIYRFDAQLHTFHKMIKKKATINANLFFLEKKSRHKTAFKCQKKLSKRERKLKKLRDIKTKQPTTAIIPDKLKSIKKRTNAMYYLRIYLV